MKASELKELNQNEIESRLEETQEELFNLRFQNATGQLDNYKRLHHLRKDVARIKTLLRERELEQTHTEAAQAAQTPAQAPTEPEKTGEQA